LEDVRRKLCLSFLPNGVQVESAVMLLGAWLVVLALFTAVTCSTVVAAPALSLKCVTFNLLHGGVFSGLTGNAQDLDRRLAMVAEELRALGADVIGLQEASTGRERGNLAARLATQLGVHYAYDPAILRLFA